ncbi:uncharacterized protein LOC134260014 [Saccostrea cucullata]|uniref:uncharacterized protein LOC134260014 n=1 Tax=Saccostrea cuccullata TaxID=36930 RepID=UPI002ED01F87
MTVEYCRNYCAKYQFYGVEYSSWCFCGNSFTTNVRKPEVECNMKCSGNDRQICGGGWRINIYRKPYHKEYLGCFQDQYNRILAEKNTNTKSMTVEYCRNFCSNYQFYGVEFSSWCFCGNSLTTNVRKSEGEFNMKCSGNNRQICGGGWRINIYRKPDQKEYLGCFQDQNNRILTEKHTNIQSMTVEYCRNYCAKYQFYGVEYSSWCFCGSSLITNVRKPEGECNMKCSGNNRQICGGGWRMNIYRKPYHKGG